ncbi:MAG: coenzyme F420-0:L-glutamate ligase [Candidatus Cloacimonadota bacterium]|nr:coenzyme F420-0:L-glutamate ligase [Candidatus Cloacimonadota bacterium]
MNNITTERTIQNRIFFRKPIKTKILNSQDDIIEIVGEYTKNVRKTNDIVVLSESPVAITQGRAVAENSIKIGLLAKLLWRGVRNVNYGVGLRSKTSMQCAIDECGKFRIIVAAFLGFFGKLVGKRGVFYRVAGKQAALVDAAHTSPVPPYNKTVIKGPINCEEICEEIRSVYGNEAAIMDINDIGGSWVIGKSRGIDSKLLEEIMNDNPQGQGDELTPICLVWEKENLT